MRYIKDNFYGGMSEDDFLWWPDRYLQSINMDVSQNSQYIQLSVAPVLRIDTWANSVRDLLSTYNRETWNREVVAFCDWFVYNEWDWLIYSWWNERRYANFVIWENVYMVRSQWYNNDYLLDTSTVVDFQSSSLNPTLWIQTLSNRSYLNGTWAVVLWTIAYIRLWDKICRFDSLLSVVDEYDITWEEIAWITYLWWYLRIYTLSWKLMLWDWNSETITESINFNVPMVNIYQVWKIDYIYSWELWWQIWLYYCSWYTLYPIFKKKYSDFLWTYKFSLWWDWYAWHNASVWDVLYWFELNDDWPTSIFKFWKDIQGLPDAYSLVNDRSSADLEFESIYCVASSWNYIYYWFNDWVTKWVERIKISLWTIKHSYWEIITNINDFQIWIKKKVARYMYFKVEDIDVNRTIEVQMAVDWWDFVSISIVNEQPLDWIARIPVQWDFRDISFKFIFRTSVNSSPKMYYWFNFDYDETEI